MITIGFVRHGSTKWNKEGRIQGSSDIALDTDGLKEASRLAERISHEQWDRVFSSSLLRALQTANQLAPLTRDTKVHLDSRLREAGGGLIEGTTEAERVAKWGVNWREQNLGVESAESMIARGTSFLMEMSAKYPGENILIVSHGSFIRTMLRHLAPDTGRDTFLNNTSLSVLHYDLRTWSCELYNCTRHLIEQEEAYGESPQETEKLVR
ncbi:histidine phosphatase family protein [Paenibacillus lutrae]|uniref:Histidine phosphatase family protein n=1 Tax=Paenibacillus lutrae TaxID=2078573 RepID=A0A7X3FE59_9BACL|nr:histidine phosphatase family protein [Paenibacillus lutrae]MVO98076.1 histidine phosphatase family protein [Paenibacillus lutrae]